MRVAALLAGVCGAQLPIGSTLAGQASVASEQRTVARAERLRASGRSAEASAALREHLERAPASSAALALLGELALESGEAAVLVPYAEAAVAAAPEEEVARLWWVRGLSGVGMLDSALAVSDRWLKEAPQLSAARLARADVQLAVGDSAGAVRTFGGAATPDRELLTRFADLLLASGGGDRLAAAWVGLLALTPPAVEEVEADLRAAEAEGSDGSRAPPDSFDQLRASLADRRDGASRAGAIVALRLGRAEAARTLAETVPDDPESAAFLRDYVREAEAAELPGEVAWSARRLVGLSARPVDRLRWLALAGEQAMAAGDTASAQRVLEELMRESAPGDGPHQSASRRLFGLLALNPASLDEAASVLDRYVSQYPDSMAAEAGMRGDLALGHARAGDLGAAEALVAEARERVRVASSGPLDAAAARLALYAGQQDSARERASRSVREAEIGAAERTRRLRLLTLVQAADTAEMRVAGAAALGLLASPGTFDPGPALRDLAGRPASSGRSVVLAFLADAAAAAGRTRIAGGLRRQVVTQHPESPEAPAALLALARASTPEEAASWLEQLIVGFPRSALAPVARRMLAELDGGNR
ncbi:hypothetical protein [Candidatus Palauibacter sp.]|uniref:hypothetical protein n=1 Tax=Candidatus Palauibacter sp. TaxID=3101350 RepID=UPI003B52A927